MWSLRGTSTRRRDTTVQSSETSTWSIAANRGTGIPSRCWRPLAGQVGAHPDPAPELAAAVTAARATAADAGRELPVVVSLTGTPGDPQDLFSCADQLSAAGAHVHLSNAAAARQAVELLAPGEDR